MIKPRLVFCIVAAGLALNACNSQPAPSSDPDVAVGGVGTVREMTTADEMLYRQKKEKDRQRNEVMDIKRQEYYDQKFRQYIKQRQ
jgi:hypothetical protein